MFSICKSRLTWYKTRFIRPVFFVRFVFRKLVVCEHFCLCLNELSLTDVRSSNLHCKVLSYGLVILSCKVTIRYPLKSGKKTCGVPLFFNIYDNYNEHAWYIDLFLYPTYTNDQNQNLQWISTYLHVDKMYKFESHPYLHSPCKTWCVLMRLLLMDWT